MQLGRQVPQEPNMVKDEPGTLVWFRKCLRIHDNAALIAASKHSGPVYPCFILDPWFIKPQKVGVNRMNFLLESLQDLDSKLQKSYGSRLLVLQGNPKEVLGKIFNGKGPFKIDRVYYERDTEPYAKKRDADIGAIAAKNGIEVSSFSGHTMYDVEEALKKNKGKAPNLMPGMVSLAKAMGEPAKPLLAPTKLPAMPKEVLSRASKGNFAVPDLKKLGYPAIKRHCGLKGGETEGLKRLETKLKNASYIQNFAKPETASDAFNPPSTTQLSPYMKFGCVSVRRFYHGLKAVCAKKKHTQPPVSLLGQLYFREMSYLQGASIPNYDKQAGNPICRQIKWSKDSKKLAAWSQGRTGFPFIDAAMRQLRRDGWMHHLARHAVSCFLTRGDLWISWEEGRDVFDQLLLDADWAVNNMNWLALSGVAPWSPPFFRVYHPVPKTGNALSVKDPQGAYIREFVPELREFPSKFIFAPWTAPMDVQKKARCVVGKDYPKPIVDHDKASKENINRFAQEMKKKRPAGDAAGGAQKKRKT